MKSSRAYIGEYNQLHKACDLIYHSVATSLGLSDCAFWILYIVQDTKGVCKQSDICENISMSRQTVNSALKKLEKDGFLTLSRIEGKMGKAIRLTDYGAQFVREHILPVMAAEERACAEFSEEEKDLFMGLFHRLTEQLSKEITGEGKRANGKAED